MKKEDILKKKIKEVEAAEKKCQQKLSFYRHTYDVEQYLSFQERLQQLEKQKEEYSAKLQETIQDNCPHSIVYFLKLYFYPKVYEPTYVCMCCEKVINGFISSDIICINEDYLRYSKDGIFGNIHAYRDLSTIYKKCQKKGMNESMILPLLEEKMKEYPRTESTIKILRKDS